MKKNLGDKNMNRIMAFPVNPRILGNNIKGKKDNNKKKNRFKTTSSISKTPA